MRTKWISSFIFIFVVLLNGCAIMAPSYTPDYSTLDALKRQKISKLAVESVEPKDQNEKVNNITLRGTTLTSPSGSYAKYLEDAIKSDLTDANLLDAYSLFRLSVLLLKNDINVTGFSSGYGTIEAKFSIKRNGTEILDKNIAVETEFESSFAGAVAIPKGQSEYPNLVRALLKKLYTDKEFINALQN
jgi:hypothetical protein